MLTGQQLRSDCLLFPLLQAIRIFFVTALDRGQQGIWREVLLPGSYRLNPYGFEVKLVDMVEIKPGNVGVLRRKLGADGPTEFASGPNEKGILRDKVLEPGLYPINTEEYEVISCPIGIYQTTYHYDRLQRQLPH